MRVFVVALAAVGCLSLAGCAELDSIGESLDVLIPTAAEPAPAEPLWVQETAAGGVAPGTVCATAAGSCPLDPPQAVGTQCSCSAQGGVSLGTVSAGAQ